MSQSAFPLVDCLLLRNTYVLLRHGRSEANQQGLIASSPQLAVSQFGLTNLGREQVVHSLEKHRDQLGPIKQIFTSDFRRTRETAKIAAELLDAPVKETTQLRERGFGEWDGKPDENYQTVWSADAEDPTHQQWGVESVFAVAYRLSQFLQVLDQSSRNQTYLIVSHGDPLQILITAANGRDLRLHRQLDPIKTAELRPLCEIG